MDYTMAAGYGRRMPEREIGVGLLGLGNVGSGVVKLFSDNAEAIAARLGARVSVRRIAVREADKPRLVAVPPGLLTTDVHEVIDDPTCDILVELIGGEEPARSYVLQAIERKRHVVTANKALLAVHGDELFSAAERSGVDVYFEAAACGGVPVIRVLREGLASDRITSLYGIVNGTSNFILSKMTDEGRAFAEVLAEAQREGYAEADPALDVDGGDAAHKLVILASLSFGTHIRLEDVYVEGIRDLEPVDLAYARRFGYVIKPLVIAHDTDEGILARVHPTLIPARWLLASVVGVNNAVYVSSQALGQSMYYGRGAGMMPTAVAVVADVIEIARNVLARASGHLTLRTVRRWRDRPVRDIGLLSCRYYLRFAVEDRPGVLAQLAGILGEHDISIGEVVQEGRREADRPATVVMLSHTARERDVRAALAKIDRLPAVVRKTRLLRIAE